MFTIGFWLLILSNVDPGAGIDLPPATDTTGRWIVGTVMLAIPVCSVLAAYFQSKKPKTNGPALAVPVSETPRLDLGQEYLEKFVKHLEDSERITQAKYEDLERKSDAKYQELERKYFDLLEKYATIKAQYEALREVVVRGRIQERDE